MVLQRHTVSPLVVLSSLVRHRDLLWEMTKREIVSRYRGSIIGIIWAFVHPLVMLAVYTLVFRGVFGGRWRSEGDSPLEFGLLLFAGLIVHSLFAETVQRAPSLIVNHRSYVKKIVFPLEILPWISLGASLFHAGISTIALMLFYGTVHHELNWTMLFLPLLLLPLALLSVGISWFLASIGVFVRDIGHAIGLVTTVMLFLSPVFYPASAIPEAYRPLFYANPLTFLVNQARDILILGKGPAWFGLAVYCLCAYVIAWLGLLWFQKARKAFADVL
jgi:lipopolysaccharide transport system permease protein